MSSRKVTVSVHRRLDAEGYIVRLVVMNEEGEKIAKYPTSTFEEANSLAESFRGYVKAGCDLSPLLGGGQERAKREHYEL